MKKIAHLLAASFFLGPIGIACIAGAILLPYRLQQPDFSDMMLTRIVTKFSGATGLEFYPAFYTIFFGPAVMGLIVLTCLARWLRES